MEMNLSNNPQAGLREMQLLSEKVNFLVGQLCRIGEDRPAWHVKHSRWFLKEVIYHYLGELDRIPGEVFSGCARVDEFHRPGDSEDEMLVSMMTDAVLGKFGAHGSFKRIWLALYFLWRRQLESFIDSRFRSLLYESCQRCKHSKSCKYSWAARTLDVKGDRNSTLERRCAGMRSRRDFEPREELTDG